jgi:Sec-independent protein secretion pathway component TatC
MSTMMTIVAAAVLTLFGAVFGVMAIFPAMLELNQSAVQPHPGNVIHLYSVDSTPHGTDHRPAA